MLPPIEQVIGIDGEIVEAVRTGVDGLAIVDQRRQALQAAHAAEIAAEGALKAAQLNIESAM